MSSCLALSACVPLEEQHSEAGTAAPPNVVATAQQGSAQTVQQMPVNFFLAQEQPAEGLSALETANGTIWLSPQAVFTQADLRTVEPRRLDGSQQAFVRFGFVAQATQTLADLSKRYAGKILVITVGRDIVGILRLDTVLDRGVLDMPVGSEQAAVRIVNAITGSS